MVAIPIDASKRVIGPGIFSQFQCRLTGKVPNISYTSFMRSPLVSEGGREATMLAHDSRPEDAGMDTLHWKIIPLKT